MRVCSYNVRFVQLKGLASAERDILAKRSCFGPPIGEETSALVAYMELEAEADTRPEEWLICPFCIEPARVVRILPFISIHPLLWPVCEKCYAKRDNLEKSIPLPRLAV